MTSTETKLSENNNRSKVVNSLVDLLNTGDEVDKCNACRALGSIGATEAIEDLILNIKDEDIDVCIDAVTALGKLRANTVVPQLLESLKKDPDGELKTAVVRSLGEIRSPDTVSILIEIAENKPEDIITDSNDEWDDWWDMQQQAIIALGKMKADGATEMLDRLLKSGDTLDIEHEILNALVNIGKKGEEIAIHHLQSGSAITRRRAAFALSLSSTKNSLKALSSAFRDSSDEVRLNALRAIVDRRATKYLPAIELLKKDRSDKVRQAAILAHSELSKSIKDRTATVTNDRLLQDQDAEVRSTYLQSLQDDANSIDGDELEKHINIALNDKDEQVLLATIPLLLKLSNKEDAEARLIQLISRPKLSTTILISCIRTLAQLSRWNVTISRLMTRLINHNDQLTRLAALEALKTMENGFTISDNASSLPKTPIDIINETLSGRVVLEIEVSSLTKQPEDTEIENIIHEGESETSEDIDEEATSTLASIMQDNDRIEKSLLESDTKTDVDTQQSDETDEFQTLVQDNITRSKWLFNEKENISVAQDVQRQACQILSKLPRHLKAEKTTQIVNNLLSVLNSNDNKLRCYAADSIAQIALDNPQTAGIEYAFGGLITQYHNENWDLKLACMRALAAIRNRGAIPILASALDHQRSAIRIQAIQSITDLLIEGDAILKNAHVAEKPPTLIEWVNTLIDQLQDKEAGVRYSAVNNLKRCLLSDEINHQEGLIKKAIEHIVQAAFNNHGGRTRDMALVLKAIEPVQGTERLIQLLNELPNSYERRFAIEMLEEMYRTDSTDAVAA